MNSIQKAIKGEYKLYDGSNKVHTRGGKGLNQYKKYIEYRKNKRAKRRENYLESLPSNYENEVEKQFEDSTRSRTSTDVVCELKEWNSDGWLHIEKEGETNMILTTNYS